MSCELICVEPARVHEIWPHVETLIRRAMERGTSDYEALAQRVWRGEALLWIVWGPAPAQLAAWELAPAEAGGRAAGGERILAAVVTALSLANERKLCTIVACAGEHRAKWLHLLDEIETFARDEGCEAMVIVGRRGWERTLPQYRRRAVILERTL